MKNLVLLVALAALGYLSYKERHIKPEPPVAAAPTPKPQLSFFLKSRFGKLFQEWKLRNAGTERKQLGRAYKLDMADIVTEIKLQGPYTDKGIEKMIASYLSESYPDDANEIASEIIKEAARDGAKRGHNRASVVGSQSY